MVVLRAAAAAVILGVAQVVVNVAELGRPAAALEAVGWARMFEEAALANREAKRPLQARRRERLAMVHLAADGRIAVELTRYDGGPPAGRAAYELALPVGAEGVAPAVEGGIACVRVAVHEPEGSEQFWRDGLAFAPAADGRLRFRAPHPHWALDVDLVPGRRPAGPTSVDAEGCVLVTLLTTNLDAELSRLAVGSLLQRSTMPWTETVNERPLRVAMVEGPSGELVELLQLSR